MIIFSTPPYIIFQTRQQAMTLHIPRWCVLTPTSEVGMNILVQNLQDALLNRTKDHKSMIQILCVISAEISSLVCSFTIYSPNMPLTLSLSYYILSIHS